MFFKTIQRTLLISLFLSCTSLYGQKISKLSFLGRPHFRIETATATYLYDLAGGGFSSIRDKEEHEWIGFKPGNGTVPESAAADFRGLPNLVFRGIDNGSGHPGFENCISEPVASNRIRTVSKSGLWEWQWTFSEQGALLEVIKTDTSRNYWFLYEGTPGGTYEPGLQFWGNNLDGHRSDAPPIGSDQCGSGTWDWAYFGHHDVKRCFYVAHLTPDQLTDNFSYMGSSAEGISSPDGMVVFGLGRDGSTPLMKGSNRFFIGFMEHDSSPEALPGKLDKHISQLALRSKKPRVFIFTDINLVGFKINRPTKDDASAGREENLIHLPGLVDIKS